MTRKGRRLSCSIHSLAILVVIMPAIVGYGRAITIEQGVTDPFECVNRIVHKIEVR
jgi:hypothetical protein